MLRTLLKASPEQERRKSLAPKPEGRMLHGPHATSGLEKLQGHEFLGEDDAAIVDALDFGDTFFACFRLA